MTQVELVSPRKMKVADLSKFTAPDRRLPKSGVISNDSLRDLDFSATTNFQPFLRFLFFSFVFLSRSFSSSLIQSHTQLNFFIRFDISLFRPCTCSFHVNFIRMKVQKKKREKETERANKKVLDFVFSSSN